MTYRRMMASALILFGGFLCAPAMANDEKKQEQPPLDEAAMAKLMADFSALAPEHEYFKKFVGQWKAVNNIYMDGASEPMATEGSTSFRLLMGGRYLQQKYESEFNGMHFEGMGLVGYDKAKKKYIGVWMDNHSTGWLATEGEFDKATKTMTEVGEMATPMGTTKVKATSKSVDRNTIVFTMYMVEPDGTEQKHMEITYTRLPRTKKKKR